MTIRDVLFTRFALPRGFYTVRVCDAKEEPSIMIRKLRPCGWLARRRPGCQSAYRSQLAPSSRAASTRRKLFEVAEEVEHALQTGQPVVALETTIYTHGIP